VFGAARISPVSCAQSVTGVPSNAVISSPGCRPACPPGGCVTGLQVVCLLLARGRGRDDAGVDLADGGAQGGHPDANEQIAKMPTARIRFITGPAIITTIRFAGCSW